MTTIPFEPIGNVLKTLAPIEAREACMPEPDALVVKPDFATAHSRA
ncbi:hypothetical protein [Sulfuritalea sp.]|nr:hypothetical protein [Sulfuritalea sp.]